MSGNLLAKASIILLTAGVCAAILWTWSPAPEEGGDFDFLDPAELEGTEITLAVAQRLYPGLRKYGRQTYDPIAGVLLRPHLQGQTTQWPEHRDGGILMWTNNLGLREDQDTPILKTRYRILVGGDSHTDGTVNNSESFSNVLETLLNESLDPDGWDPPVEVLNGGIGGTGPYGFLGALRSRLELDPDMYIGALFTGNDFQNALVVSSFLNKTPMAVRSDEYVESLSKAKQAWSGRVSQGMNQARRYADYPSEADDALAETIGYFDQMRVLCKSRGIRFVTVIVPTKTDVDLTDGRDAIDGMLDLLGLDAEEYGVNARLARDFARAMEERGALCVDPTDAMRARQDPLYWQADHHLNVEGHALIARHLFDAIQDDVRRDVEAGR